MQNDAHRRSTRPARFPLREFLRSYLLATSRSTQDTSDSKLLSQFFSKANATVAEAERRQRELDRLQATRFNVFELIEPDENKLSDILADLLDPYGRHGQGSLFLSLLLEQLGAGVVHFPISRVRIVREAATLGVVRFRRRIDILLEADVLIAIENKVDSPEQWEQVKDYLEYLRIHSSDWRTPAFLIYLTPNGRCPTSVIADSTAIGRLLCWSYERDLRCWLKSCESKCESLKIDAPDRSRV